MRALHLVPETPPKAVLYLRQSVARDDSISIELQEIAGRDYCEKHGYKIVATEIDEGISGRTWHKRPAVQRAMDLIESKQADVIILWKWSRLSRSRKDWALASDRVDVAGGRIESATEPIDTATASGRFARGVMTEYAAFQSEQIGEQWAEAHMRRFNMGLPPNGPYPWGWEKHDEGIRPVPERAQTLRDMFDLYFAGVGFSKIASELNQRGIKAVRGGAWSPASVQGTMDSPIHAGLIEYRGVIKDGLHQGVISPAEREVYWEARKQRHRPRKPRVSQYLLSGLVVCHCGLKRGGASVRGRGARSHVTYTGYRCESRTGHPQLRVPTHKVDIPVGEWIKTLNTEPIPGTGSLTVDAESIAREITANEKRLVRLTEHLIDGVVPQSAYEKTRDSIEQANTKLAEDLRVAQIQSQRSSAMFIQGNEDLIGSWDLLSFDTKKQLAAALIDSVTVNEDLSLNIVTRWNELVVLTD